MRAPRRRILSSLVLPWLAILTAAGAESRASAAGGGANLLVAGGGGVLDRVAYAVDGLESGHGADPRMWRSEPDGPQGPMQVSAAAAADAGGGDRFDERENRALGRAYLARMFRRYGSWPDAVAAYNWGPGRMDLWISGGRPIDKLPSAVALYRIRVLAASGFPIAAGDPLYRPAEFRFRLASRGIVHMQPRRPLGDRHHLGNGRDPVDLLYIEIMRATAPAAR
jgi:Transglycosylase SLT domain